MNNNHFPVKGRLARGERVIMPADEQSVAVAALGASALMVEAVGLLASSRGNKAGRTVGYLAHVASGYLVACAAYTQAHDSI